jgi:C4-type Zn-finger protein
VAEEKKAEPQIDLGVPSDGPRYTVGRQVDGQTNWWKDFKETDKLAEAREAAEKAAAANRELSVIVYDRKEGVIIERFNTPEKKAETQKSRKK